MLKAIFMDYTGTIIEDGGPDAMEMVARCYKNSDIESPQAMFAYWWENLKKLERKCTAENFLTEDEIVDELLRLCVEDLHLNEDLDDLHRLCNRYWMYAPAFSDVKEFFDNCTLPVYLVTNISERYVLEGMKTLGIHPAGIISGNDLRVYKPHKELFERALEISGCAKDEVIHVGDSVNSDVAGANAAGIRPVLLDRKGKVSLNGVETAGSLKEVLNLISTEERFYLESPSASREEDAKEYIQEHAKYESHINGAGGLNRFAEDYPGWLQKLADDRTCTVDEEKVPSETYFLIRANDSRIVGMVNIRLGLNELLRSGNGHIGYGIRPAERQKGYNKINLYLALKECRRRGMDQVILCCNSDNLASARSIEALSGILEKEGIGPLYEWPVRTYRIDICYSLAENETEFEKKCLPNEWKRV